MSTTVMSNFETNRATLRLAHVGTMLCSESFAEMGKRHQLLRFGTKFSAQSTITAVSHIRQLASNTTEERNPSDL